jgi:CelD/BcsL family acetyltransferase involved in cellulose biosynthesis
MTRLRLSVPPPLPSTTFQLEPLEALEAPEEEWRELAERSTNIFGTQEWISIWWRHFGAGRPLFVTACRSREGRLVAILPLYLWSNRPVRILRFLGHGGGSELGPICAPSERPAAALALRQALAETPWRWDVLLGEHLPAHRCWGELLGARMVRQHGNPVLHLNASNWEEFVNSLSSKLRQNIRYQERRLAREHELRYRLADDPRRLEHDLDSLFALHKARWPEGASGFAGPREVFHREFAACALDRGWLRLWFLELDGHPVAVWYGFRFRGVQSFYQAGRDPAWDKESVGSVILSHSIRDTLEDGLDEYRFLEGDDPYKYRFTKDDPGLVTVGISGSAFGRAALAAGRATRGMRVFPTALRGPLDL